MKPGIHNLQRPRMQQGIRVAAAMLRRTAGSLRDLAPIILVVVFFQVVVLQQPFPDIWNVTLGLLCVVAGLTLFIQGLESGLFPLGEGTCPGFRQEGQPLRAAGLRLLPGFRDHRRRTGPDCHHRRSGGCRG